MKENIIVMNGKRWKKVQKRTAKKFYDSGADVYFCPCNLNPVNPWGLGMIQNKRDYGQYETFEKLYNNYCFYNCTCETGLYPHFYIQLLY